MHLHLHCAIIDGVFDAAVRGLVSDLRVAPMAVPFSAPAKDVRFREATALGREDIAAVERAVRKRVLRLSSGGACSRPRPQPRCANEAWGRLLARRRGPHRGPRSKGASDCSAIVPVRSSPAKARARESPAGRTKTQRVYSLPNRAARANGALPRTPGVPRPAGSLGPPPRRHRHRYHGVLAPHAPLRAAVTARAGLPMVGPVHDTRLSQRRPKGAMRPPASHVPVPAISGPCCSHASYESQAQGWGLPGAPRMQVFPLACFRCGEPKRIIAFITEAGSIRRMLEYLEPTHPPAHRPRAPEVRPIGVSSPSGGRPVATRTLRPKTKRCKTTLNLLSSQAAARGRVSEVTRNAVSIRFEDSYSSGLRERLAFDVGARLV